MCVCVCVCVCVCACVRESVEQLRGYYWKPRPLGSHVLLCVWGGAERERGREGGREREEVVMETVHVSEKLNLV